MIDFSLNALDQSAITTASDASQAVYETVELACYLDGLGFRRFWLAEHHNTAAFAGAAPEVLIAHIASRTSRISVGSGGIMLPHYAPLKVAEQFRMLETLAPGRIDLGIGRAPGGDPKTTAALQSGPKAWPVEVFPQQVEILLQFLEDAMGLSGDQGGFAPDHPYQGIHAQPRGAGRVPVWMLGSGGDGAFHARDCRFVCFGAGIRCGQFDGRRGGSAICFGQSQTRGGASSGFFVGHDAGSR